MEQNNKILHVKAVKLLKFTQTVHVGIYGHTVIHSQCIDSEKSYVNQDNSFKKLIGHRYNVSKLSRFSHLYYLN